MSMTKIERLVLVEKLAPSIMEWFEANEGPVGGFDLKEIQNELSTVLSISPSYDGYDLAFTYNKQFQVTPDTDLVNRLDKVGMFVDNNSN